MTQKKTNTCRRYSTRQETLYAIEERRKINKDAVDVVPMTAWETREGVYWESQERHEACTMTRGLHKEGHLQQTGQGQKCIKRNEQHLEICRSSKLPTPSWNYQRCARVASTLVFGSKCWGMTETYLSKLWSFHTTCLWQILWTFWHKKISNEDLAARQCHVIKRTRIP